MVELKEGLDREEEMGEPMPVKPAGYVVIMLQQMDYILNGLKPLYAVLLKLSDFLKYTNSRTFDIFLDTLSQACKKMRK